MGELREAGRAGTGEGEIGGAVSHFHLMAERRDVRRDFLAPVIGGGNLVIIRAGQMDDLDPTVP